ncbi:uncharacterized protein LOC134646966 isoform X2 [Pelmatolapia mariae]|uniref:uncharacterized protein LOC134646966 isoform X2 n=1 Tax=Pelmatolapia mariae TaxID=158779 RepID=UPI002FE62DBC
MGNLLFSTGLIRTDATKSDQVNRRHLIAKTICNGITYYYTPLTGTGCETECFAKEFQDSAAVCPTFPVSPSAGASSSTPLSDLPSNTSVSSQKQSYSASTSRPLLLFFSWLGAQPGGIAKYRDLYLDRGMDVLLVQSSVMHFLWPRWGLDYGLEVLKILENPPFAGRVMLVHASSIGGYTFTQILTHIVREPKKHAGLAQRMMGHIYDSLVVGTLEHMAIVLKDVSCAIIPKRKKNILKKSKVEVQNFHQIHAHDACKLLTAWTQSTWVSHDITCQVLDWIINTTKALKRRHW